MRRFWIALLVIVMMLTLVDVASACPMCAENGTDKNLPRAFMYSILFMLAMPPTVFCGIGFAIWRAHRRHAKLTAAAIADASVANAASAQYADSV